jgi:hypothetical protein
LAPGLLAATLNLAALERGGLGAAAVGEVGTVSLADEVVLAFDAKYGRVEFNRAVALGVGLGLRNRGWH